MSELRDCPDPPGYEKTYGVAEYELVEIESLRQHRNRLYTAIKKHHDQKADDRCWMDDNELYAAAGLDGADTRIGDPAAMLENCKRFVTLRCFNGGPWKSYVELEAENEKLRKDILSLAHICIEWGNLKAALRSALWHIHMHNVEYQHVTPETDIAAWKELVK